jgi:hypothetical protein
MAKPYIRAFRRPLALALAAILAGGCATTVPVAEVRLVGKAFDDLNAASQPLLDDLALAEREQGRRNAVARAGAIADGATPKPNPCPDVVLRRGTGAAVPNVQAGFCAPDAGYYSDLVDPPATRAFRRSLAAIGDYSRLLLMLAEGRNIDEANTQLHAVAWNVGVAVEASGLGGASVIAPSLLEALNPLVELAARDANAAELRRLVREETPKVERLALAVRDGAPALFKTLTGSALARYSTDGLANAEVARAEAQRIEGYRIAVSNYVVLLDEYALLLRELGTLYDQPRGGRLAQLAERSADLSMRADAWRRTLAGLRTGLR